MLVSQGQIIITVTKKKVALKKAFTAQLQSQGKQGMIDARTELHVPGSRPSMIHNNFVSTFKDSVRTCTAVV